MTDLKRGFNFVNIQEIADTEWNGNKRAIYVKERQGKQTGLTKSINTTKA